MQGAIARPMRVRHLLPCQGPVPAPFAPGPKIKKTSPVGKVFFPGGLTPYRHFHGDTCLPNLYGVQVPLPNFAASSVML